MTAAKAKQRQQAVKLKKHRQSNYFADTNSSKALVSKSRAEDIRELCLLWENSS
ncbi:MAG: hypothetical protein WCA35_03300 [Kovacikia sp.]